jgi:hypothetical protein
MHDSQFLAGTRHRAPAQIPSRLGASARHQLAGRFGRLVQAGDING